MSKHCRTGRLNYILSGRRVSVLTPSEIDSLGCILRITEVQKYDDLTLQYSYCIAVSAVGDRRPCPRAMRISVSLPFFVRWSSQSRSPLDLALPRDVYRPTCSPTLKVHSPHRRPIDSSSDDSEYHHGPRRGCVTDSAFVERKFVGLVFQS